RLGYLSEAADLTAASGDAERALGICRRGLAFAVAVAAPLSPWLERIDRLGEQLGAPGPRAEALSFALADRPVDGPELARLAREAGEALALAGALDRAIEVLRRALAFEPEDTALMSRIDDL